MFINSEYVDFDDQCAQLFSKSEIPALEKLTIYGCTMSEKGAELISKSKCENMK